MCVTFLLFYFRNIFVFLFFVTFRFFIFFSVTFF